MPDTGLEQALDELYASEPGEFVSMRKQLVANLRAAGDPAGADQLKVARRPSTSAWALNRLARSQPQLVEAFLERSDALRVAQSRPRSGQLDTMQDTIRAHRRALADATEAAVAVLGPRANDGFRNEIVSSLRAASTDADVGRQLALGRLVREVDSSSGFPDASHLTLVPESAARELRPVKQSPAKSPPRERAARPDHSKAIAAAANAERETHRREVALRDQALQQATAAETDVNRAEVRVDELERELDAARRELRDARTRSRKANAEAARPAAKLRGRAAGDRYDAAPDSVKPS